MMRFLLLIILAMFTGCSPMSRPSAKGPIEKMIVNTTELTSSNGAGIHSSYHATWNSNHYSVAVVANRKREGTHAMVDGILRTVRNDSPNKQPFEFSSERWPEGSSVYGVTRAGNLEPFRQAEFYIRSPYGGLMMVMFAEREPITEQAIREFFQEVEILPDGFRFPADAGTGNREESTEFPTESDFMEQEKRVRS